MEVMYRYYDVQYASPLNEYDEHTGPGKVAIELMTFDIIKYTKCGVRIDDYTDKGKFINLNSRKKFACATKEEALESFIHRKERQMVIYKSQLRQATQALELARLL